MSALHSLVRPTGDSWRGHWRACRGCGSTRVGELADGYCLDCFADTFGPLGLDDIPPIEEETMDDHAAYDLPAAPTLAVVPAPPAQTHRCAKCKADKPFEAFSASMLAKSPGSCWCRECVASYRARTKTTTPAPAETRTCARCGDALTQDGFSASMWERASGSRWCRACDRAYHDERKAALADPSTNGVVVIEMGWELDDPAPLAPPSAKPAAPRSVADELRALLETLARERATLLEEQERLTARLADLITQCDAVSTTIALVTR